LAGLTEETADEPDGGTRLFSTTGTVTGIDLGSTSVKLVRARDSRGTGTLLNVCLEELPATDQETWEAEATRAIERILKDSKLSRRDLGRVALAVGGASVHVRQVDLPTLTDPELRSSIKYEARKHLPIESLSEAAVDCQVMTRHESAQKMSVLFAGAPDALVKSRVRIAQRVGIEPELVEPSALSLLNGFYAQPHDKAMGTLSIIDLGASGATLVFSRPGGVVYSRTVTVPGPKISGEEGIPAETVTNYARTVAAALRESAQFYSTMNARRHVETVFLAGGNALIEGLEQALAGFLGIPVSPLDLTQGLHYSPSGSEGMTPELIKKTAPQFAVALGLLFWGTVNVPD
jgi:type IV pilus assembly protein PilM